MNKMNMNFMSQNRPQVHQAFPKTTITQPMENLIDFATTACNRPDILEKTYASLAKRIKGINLRMCRLFLNVDPMPNGENMEANVEVAKKYFGEVIYNLTEKGSFPRAFRWCMDKIERPYCFYVQDDWGFVQDFNVRTLISLVKQNNLVASINLYKTDGGSSNSNRIYLSPSLFKTNHFKKINQLLLPDYSPEKQLRPMNPTKNPHPYGGRILKILKYYGICYRPNLYPVVIDLGRTWMKDQGLQKSSGIFGNFQSWKSTRPMVQSSKSNSNVNVEEIMPSKKHSTVTFKDIISEEIILSEEPNPQEEVFETEGEEVFEAEEEKVLEEEN